MDKINNEELKLKKLREQLIMECLQKNDYEYEKYLGEGQFSKVIQAKSLKDQSKVAIKIFKNDQNQKINLELFKQEVQILQRIQNEKYVIQYINKIEDQESGVFAIVTELCDSDLTNIMKVNKFSLEQVIALSYQLLRGLILLQMKGIIHTDIKPDNILYSKSKNSFLICDFGLSKIIQDPSLEKTMSSLEGNFYYKSPEVINNQKPYTFATAIYSIGIILVEVFIQRRLDGMEYLNLKSRSLLSVFPELQNSKGSQFINQILSKMVEPERSQRLESLKLIQLLNYFQVNEESFKALVILDEDPDFLSLQPKTQFTNQSNFPIKFYEYQIPKFIIPEQIMDDTILLKKICLVGYYCAGKDCILGRLQKIGFLSETKATIGTEYSNIIFALKNGQKINLQIQNASGNKKYQEIVYKYTRGTSGFVFCFDITEKKSFEELKEELPKIKEYGVPILILGNKIDLYERRQVDTQLVIDLANQNNLALAICSAKTGENIQEPFDNLAEEIFRRHVIEQFSKINSSGQLQNQQQQQEIKKEQQQQQELKNEWQQKLKKEYQLELKNNIQLQKKNISKNQKNQKCF